jgi:selenocysteine-specific elongation factor
MKSIIVGTAGHIDHGKTALVKALTGIDADRLVEEKRRGITIDLGFAHMDLPAANGDVLRIGFVDVPGHERFVRNMLAGVGGMDLVLLVIAADESIKPQTREHFDILQLIGVKHGITVLTKSDAVDADTLDVVRLEVQEFVRGTFLEHAPILAVSSLTGAGLDDLKLGIVSAGTQLKPRDSETLARLPIDRVFTMRGFGTVVTGTLISGIIRKEEELQVFPGARSVRVRGIQIHGSSAEIAVAGQRTALNVTGASTEDLSRGMVLSPPGAFAATRRLDVQLRLLSSAPRPLKNRARVHFHCHTMETVAEIVLHESRQIDPGQEIFARMRFPNTALLLPGDRFIIRELSPVLTIGGGTVLDTAPLARSLPAKSALEILASEDRTSILRYRIERRGHAGISLPDLVKETGWNATFIASQLAKSVAKRQIVHVGDIFLGRSAWEEINQQIVSTVSEFHKRNPLSGGISKEELREQSRADAISFDAALQSLVLAKKLEIGRDLVRIPGRGIEMKDEEAESKAKIEQAFASAGLRVPALPEVLSGLKIDGLRAQKIVTLLLREKVLMKISDDLVFHTSALTQLRRQIEQQKSRSRRMDVAQFKELTGVSRKYAIPLLEYLDREHVTRRVGDAREIL